MHRTLVRHQMPSSYNNRDMARTEQDVHIRARTHKNPSQKNANSGILMLLAEWSQ